jgi:hypothetical protein
MRYNCCPWLLTGPNCDEPCHGAQEPMSVRFRRSSLATDITSIKDIKDYVPPASTKVPTVDEKLSAAAKTPEPKMPSTRRRLLARRSPKEDGKTKKTDEDLLGERRSFCIYEGMESEERKRKAEENMPMATGFDTKAKKFFDFVPGQERLYSGCKCETPCLCENVDSNIFELNKIQVSWCHVGKKCKNYRMTKVRILLSLSSPLSLSPPLS